MKYLIISFLLFYLSLGCGVMPGKNSPYSGFNPTKLSAEIRRLKPFDSLIILNPKIVIKLPENNLILSYTSQNKVFLRNKDGGKRWVFRTRDSSWSKVYYQPKDIHD